VEKNASVRFVISACAVNASTEHARKGFVAQEAGYGARRKRTFDVPGSQVGS
jgi:hypothetical protein